MGMFNRKPGSKAAQPQAGEMSKVTELERKYEELRHMYEEVCRKNSLLEDDAAREKGLREKAEKELASHIGSPNSTSDLPEALIRLLVLAAESHGRNIRIDEAASIMGLNPLDVGLHAKDLAEMGLGKHSENSNSIRETFWIGDDGIRRLSELGKLKPRESASDAAFRNRTGMRRTGK
jgi:hypothetical protein